MCELLGISANVEVGVSFSWAAFDHRGRWNRDGWGFQYRSQQSLVTHRFPNPLDKDARAADLIGPVQTMAFLAHVRHAVQGRIALHNTQPFVDEALRFGIVATMSRCRVSKRFRRRVRAILKGQTGTEVLFRLLVEKLQEKRETQRKAALLDVVAEVFDTRRLPDRASASFLLTDGHRVYAFRHKKPLWTRTRRPPHAEIVQLRDPAQPDYRVDLSLEKGGDETATVLASTPLTDEEWEEVPDRTVLSVAGGEIVWQRWVR